MLKRLYNSFKIFYSPKFPEVITYMLQSTEYNVVDYIIWFWTTEDFSKVEQRKKLDKTETAVAIYRLMSIGILAELLAGLIIVILGITGNVSGGIGYGLAIAIFYPVLWSQLIIIPVCLGRIFVFEPKERKLVHDSKEVFANHKATKIVVAGSYGKTSMKEILATVLAEGKNVAATPANKNVPISHAHYALGLKGKEDILIIELGEGAPGDVVRFANTIKPDIAVITGLSPAHLNKYKTIEAAGKDIFSLSKHVKEDSLFVNAESSMAKPFFPNNANTYDEHGALGWKVTDAKTSIEGTSFTLSKDSAKLKLSSPLIGRHQIGPLAFAAALAKKLGLSDSQVVEGIAKTKAFEHRMQPYKLNEAWIIDDTYNGNIEGIRVGTELLADLPAKRKIYVSPGLVDQGKESSKIHRNMGMLIAKAKPNQTVLMKNSATAFIQAGLEDASYKGELSIESNPLNFYENLSNFVASGDLVLMQNDWTDNYR